MTGDQADEPTPERLIERTIVALNARDAEALETLLTADASVTTGRATHDGRAEAIAWAQRTYDHLERRWVADQLIDAGSGWIVVGRVQYVWREGGEVADSSPTAMSFVIDDAQVVRIGVHDDERQAREALGGAT